jgi:hypothetical protein
MLLIVIVVEFAQSSTNRIKRWREDEGSEEEEKWNFAQKVLM